MAIEIFPTENDVGGAGRVAREFLLAGLAKGVQPTRNHVISGLTPTDPGGLQVDVAAGVAWISGFRVNVTAALAITVTDTGSERWVYLKLDKSGSPALVTASPGAVLVEQAELTAPPADSLLIARAKTNGIGGYNLRDAREGAGSSTGEYTGTGSGATQTVTLPLPPSLLFVSSSDPIIFSVAGPWTPGQREGDYAPGIYLQELLSQWHTGVTQKALGSSTLSGSIPGGTTPAASRSTKTVTATGASLGDMVLANITGDKELMVSGRVSAANTVNVIVFNPSGASINVDGETLSVRAYGFQANTLHSGLGTPGTFDAIDSTTIGTKTPRIKINGFEVSGSLNESGKVYRYHAIH